MRYLVILFLLLASPCWGGVTFDTTDDKITMDDITTLNISVTISLWATNVYNDGESANGKHIASEWSSWGITMNTATTPDIIRCQIAADSGTSVEFDNLDNLGNGWHNYVCTYDGTTVTTYVDGAATGNTLSNTGSLTGTGSTTIGAYFGSDSFVWNGIVNEFAVWNTALTASEVALLYNSKVKRIPLQIQPTKLQAYLPLDAVSDGASADAVVFKDLTGNGYDGTGVDGANNTGLTGTAEVNLTYP
jgi:hypothetical protein